MKGTHEAATNNARRVRFANPPTFLHRRHTRPRGNNIAKKIPGAMFLPGSCSSFAVVVLVEIVSVVLCAVLLPENARLAGEKVQAAAVGSAPQVNVAVPE
jgi:hypothetical protein